jgi:hypothetical protein
MLMPRSFYAFAIWIGLGVLGIAEGLRRFLPETVSAGIAGALTLALVPGIMAAENWDDHDRSGRYTARDFGANYLVTCQLQMVLFLPMAITIPSRSGTTRKLKVCAPM